MKAEYTARSATAAAGKISVNRVAENTPTHITITNENKRIVGVSFPWKRRNVLADTSANSMPTIMLAATVSKNVIRGGVSDRATTASVMTTAMSAKNATINTCNVLGTQPPIYNEHKVCHNASQQNVCCQAVKEVFL
jgi:hypothetical protein